MRITELMESLWTIPWWKHVTPQKSVHVSSFPSKDRPGRIYVDTSEGTSIVSYRLIRDETNRVTIAYKMVSGPDVLGPLNTGW